MQPWRSARNDCWVAPGRPSMRSTNSGRSAARNSSSQLVVLGRLDVRPFDCLEHLAIHGLERQQALVEDAGVGQDADDLPQVLRRVLRVVRREQRRVAVRRLQLRDLLRDLHVPLHDPEVRIGEEDPGDVALRAPLELGEDPREIELPDAGQRGRAPVAERAAVRAPAVRLEDRHRRTASGVHVEDAREEWRRDDVELGQTVPLPGPHDVVAVDGTRARGRHAAPTGRVGRLPPLQRVPRATRR